MLRLQIVPSGGASHPPLPLAPLAGIPPRGFSAAAGVGILPRRYPSAGGGSFRTAPVRHRGSAPPAPLSPARPGPERPAAAMAQILPIRFQEHLQVGAGAGGPLPSSAGGAARGRCRGDAPGLPAVFP